MNLIYFIKLTVVHFSWMFDIKKKAEANFYCTSIKKYLEAYKNQPCG
jgi:hypothetical protein